MATGFRAGRHPIRLVAQTQRAVVATQACTGQNCCAYPMDIIHVRPYAARQLAHYLPSFSTCENDSRYAGTPLGKPLFDAVARRTSAASVGACRRSFRPGTRLVAVNRVAMNSSETRKSSSAPTSSADHTICRCPCHTGAVLLNPAPCCEHCPICKRRIPLMRYNAHVQTCSAKRP